MARLRAVRMTNGTLVSQIDDYIGELETDLATIFGYTPDVDVTESAFGCDNSGRLTKALIRRVGALNAHGDAIVHQITNTDNSNVVTVGLARLQTESLGGVSKLYFVLGNAEEPVDDRDVAFLAFRLDSYINGYFAIHGQKFSSAAPGLLPAGSGNADEYLCSDGTYRNPLSEFTPELAVLSDPVDASSGTNYYNNTFTSDVSEVPVWHSERHDDYGLHAANDDEIIIVTNGKYLIGCQPRVIDYVGVGGLVTVSLIRKRGGADTTLAIANYVMPSIGGDPIDIVFGVDAIDDCEAADKIRVTVLYEKGGGEYAISASPEENHFYALRVA